MAGNYIVETQLRDIQVLGPTFVMPVQRAGIRTSPHGVYVEYPVPLTLWQQNQGADVLGPLATGIEAVIAEGLAIGGEYVQDFDANSLLTDFLSMTVAYTPPGGVRAQQTTTVLIPLEAFIASQGDPFFAALGVSPASLLTDAYDHLVALANA